MGGGGYILAVLVDILACGGWCWIYICWWWVVVDICSLVLLGDAGYVFASIRW